MLGTFNQEKSKCNITKATSCLGLCNFLWIWHSYQHHTPENDRELDKTWLQNRIFVFRIFLPQGMSSFRHRLWNLIWGLPVVLKGFWSSCSLFVSRVPEALTGKISPCSFSKYEVTINLLLPWSVMPLLADIQAQKAMTEETALKRSNWSVFTAIFIGNSQRWIGWTNSIKSWGMEALQKWQREQRKLHRSGALGAKRAQTV